jgi:hypothetical protein
VVLFAVAGSIGQLGCAAAGNEWFDQAVRIRTGCDLPSALVSASSLDLMINGTVSSFPYHSQSGIDRSTEGSEANL